MRYLIYFDFQIFFYFFSLSLSFVSESKNERWKQKCLELKSQLDDQNENHQQNNNSSSHLESINNDNNDQNQSSSNNNQQNHKISKLESKMRILIKREEDLLGF